MCFLYLKINRPDGAADASISVGELTRTPVAGDRIVVGGDDQIEMKVERVSLIPAETDCRAGAWVFIEDDDYYSWQDCDDPVYEAYAHSGIHRPESICEAADTYREWGFNVTLRTMWIDGIGFVNADDFWAKQYPLGDFETV